MLCLLSPSLAAQRSTKLSRTSIAGSPPGQALLVSLGIPARTTRSGREPNSHKELVAEIAQLRQLLEANSAEPRELSECLSLCDARITEFERLLSESRRSGKRQAAPFSKGDPREEPARPGSAAASAHGRHGHRMAPTATPTRRSRWRSRRALWTAAARSSSSGLPTRAEPPASPYHVRLRAMIRASQNGRRRNWHRPSPRP